MDLAILLGTLFLCFGIGMPISYSLGIGALAGALWIGIPPEAVMLKISDGVSKVAMLTIPFFVLAGAIMAEGGMAAPPGQARQRDRRGGARARRTVGGEHPRHHFPERHLRLCGRRHLGDRLGDDPADGEERLSPRLRHQRHDHAPRCRRSLVPPSHNAVIYSLATGGTISIISLFMAGVVPGLLLGFALSCSCIVHGLSRRPPARRGGAAAATLSASPSTPPGA